jgi:hypothetical protein
VQSVALGGLEEFVRWMSRTKFISEQLPAIITTVLDNLQRTQPLVHSKPQVGQSTISPKS